MIYIMYIYIYQMNRAIRIASFLFQTYWGPVVWVKRFGLTRPTSRIYTFPFKLTPLMCLLAKIWSSKLWLWEFKQKSIFKENLHIFLKSPQQQLHKHTKMRWLFGEGCPNYEGYTHFCWRGDRIPYSSMDPSWWMDVSCGVLGPGFRWISRIHWTSSPSSTGATRLFGGLRLTPKKRHAKKRRWRFGYHILYMHIYI